MLHLYGVLPPGSGVTPPAQGVQGGPVRAIATRAAVAWVSELTAPLDARAVAEHLAVLQSALQAGVTPLPARPGQQFRDEAEVTAVLDARAGEMAPALARVAGGCEMVLRLRARGGQSTDSESVLGVGTRSRYSESGLGVGARSRDSESGLGVGTQSRYSESTRRPAPGPGRAYLERLRSGEESSRALHAMAEGVRESLARELSDLVREDALGDATGSAEDRSITLAHLVSCARVSEYRRRLRGVLPVTIDETRWTWALAGPIPPFSFADRTPSTNASRD